MKSRFLVLASVLPGLIGGCSREPATAVTQITGLVQYQTPIELESGATLELRLTDVSGEDGAVEVASSTVSRLKSLPYQYALPYEADRIDVQRRYMVEARIFIGDKPRFSTDTAYPVLTQGNGAVRNITVIAVGASDPSRVYDTDTPPEASVFHGELRRDREVTLYKIGIQDGSIHWLEEDRSNGTPQTLHARYEFKGALIMRYADTSPMEISFDERGRPTGIVRNGKALQLSEQGEVITAVRNRAALLRSHALASRETQSHRKTTGG